MQLWLNDQLVGTQKPDTDKNSTHLVHPPFTFNLKDFESGTLKAVGLIAGEIAGEHVVKTPGKAVGLQLWLDESGKAPQSGCNDTVFLYIAVVDENGTVVPDRSDAINFQVEGDVVVKNVGPIQAEAGIAAALLQIGNSSDELEIKASARDLKIGKLRVKLHH